MPLPIAAFVADKLKPLLFLFALSLVTPHVFAETSFPCGEYWGGKFPVPRFANLTCSEFFDSGNGIRIFRDMDRPTGTPEDMQVLRTIQESAVKSVDHYTSMLHKEMPYVYIVYVGTEGIAHDGVVENGEAATQHIGRGQPCPVVLFKSDILHYQKPVLQQLVAHEVFHCFQFYNLYDQTEGLARGGGGSTNYSVNFAPAKWWHEGSADFFSNTVYPETNNEYGNSGDYDPGLPLYRQNSAYSSSIFFQSFANSFEKEIGVFQLLEQMPTSGTLVEQHQAIGNANMIQFRFHDFAKQLATSTVMDSSKKTYHPAVRMEVEPTRAVLPNNPPIPISISPFTVKRFRLAFPKNGLFKVRYQGQKPEDKAQMSYRLDEHSPYQIMIENIDDAIDTSCRDDDLIYEYILTTTHPDDSSSVVGMSFEYEPRPCTCIGKAPFNRCLIGKWRLDRKSFDAIFPLGSGMSYRGSEGDLFYEIGANETLRMKVDNLAIQYDLSSKSPSGNKVVSVANTLTGMLSSEIGSLDSQTLCLRNTTGEVRVRTQTRMGGEAQNNETLMPLPYEGKNLTYTCKGKSLIIDGELPIGANASILHKKMRFTKVGSE